MATFTMQGYVGTAVQRSPTPSDRNLKALTVWEPRYPNKASSKGSQQSLRVKLAFFKFISARLKNRGNGMKLNSRET